jgi:hypothetical protein
VTQPAAAGTERKTESHSRIGWILAGVILLSFAFGVMMYLPPEHRAQKLEEIKQKYDAKQQHYRRLTGNKE